MALRVVVTLVCLALYFAGSRWPLPLIDSSFLEELGGLGLSPGSRISWIPLGITPFVTGFLVVELFTLIVPTGRRIRREGIEGRRKIDRAALFAATLLTFVQSAMLARYLVAAEPSWSGRVTEAPAWLLTLTFAAGVFALVGLALAISRFGLGDGFVMLFVVPRVVWLALDVVRYVRGDGAPGSEIDAETVLAGVIFTGLFVAVLTYLFRRPRTVEATTPDGKVLPLEVPALPQGVAPLSWIYVIPGLLLLFPGLVERVTPPPGSWLGPALAAGGIVLLSLIGSWMFSAPGRAATNLEGIAEPPRAEYARVFKVQLAIATAVIVIGHLLPDVTALSGARPIWIFLSVSLALFLVATVLDLVDEVRLHLAAPAVVPVLTMDNVFLADALRRLLEREEIPHAVRGFRFRRLGYFFAPLFKMTLLVPASHAERAEAVVEATDFRIL